MKGKRRDTCKKETAQKDTGECIKKNTFRENVSKG